MRGATNNRKDCAEQSNFNPRSPCGERLAFLNPSNLSMRFQSTLPMRGATSSRSIFARTLRFQSTLPMRGATIYAMRKGDNMTISIHAPHAGSDCKYEIQLSTDGISIHAPHAGSDSGFQCSRASAGISIHAPHAGSDITADALNGPLTDFNPRSPCGERPGNSSNAIASTISIHAPHAGSDNTSLESCHVRYKFQSTLPMRGATAAAFHRCSLRRFQSTLPMRGATVKQKTLNPCGIQHIILRTS